ncbi:MAG: helix-turn-helix domain-containing protein, partial [Chloroflexota bacterium]
MGWGNTSLTGFGELLQQARAYKGVSLRDVERTTRIPRRHLSALEKEEFHQLPPLIYARGIVRNYAQYLGLDPVETLSRFEQSHGQRSGGFRVVPAVRTVDVPSHWAPNFAIIAFMVVMSAVIFAWMYSAYFAPTDGSNPTEQASSSPTSEQDFEVAGEDESESGLAEGGGESLPTPGEENDEREQPDTAENDSGTSDGGENEVSGESESTPEGSEGDSEPTPEPTPTPEGPTEHTFTITPTQEVWIQATVDGEIVFDEVVQPGNPVTLEGQEMTLT